MKYDTMQVFADDTIKDIKLRLRNRGWFTTKHCLVFGDRELLEHEKIADVAKSQASPSNFLHVMVRLSDIEAVTIRTMKRDISLNYLADPTNRQSALTAALKESTPALTSEPANSPSQSTPRSCLTDALIRQNQAEPDAADRNRAVVHLVVSKSAKVSWKHLESDRFELDISSSETVTSLKRRLQDHDMSLSPQDVDLVYAGRVLDEARPLASYGIGRGSVLQLCPVSPSASSSDKLPDGSPLLSSPLHQLHYDWLKAQAGLAGGQTPKLAKAGTGGSYFLQGLDGDSVAVFKPEDEEPHAVNNPRGLSTSPSGEGLRRGTRPGEGAVREVAAYVLDHDHFSGVPPTALVTLNVDGSPATPPRAARKVGSLQQFVKADSDCEERGPSAFPVHEVHKICILDLRLANTDRNGGNILARKTSCGVWELVPIDHGYCLPASFEDISFEWLYWPQAREPFSERSLAYIAALDVEHDLRVLAAHDLHLRPDCVRVMRVCTMLLKAAAQRGLSPYEIGCIMSREGFTKSPLEKLHHEAVHQVLAQEMGRGRSLLLPTANVPVPEAPYLKMMEQLVEELLEDRLSSSSSEGSEFEIFGPASD